MRYGGRFPWHRRCVYLVYVCASHCLNNNQGQDHQKINSESDSGYKFTKISEGNDGNLSSNQVVVTIGMTANNAASNN